MSDGSELLFWFVFDVLGRPLRAFRAWLDRQPHRDPSQISTLHKVGRLTLGASTTLAILLPLGWLIFR